MPTGSNLCAAEGCSRATRRCTARDCRPRAGSLHVAVLGQKHARVSRIGTADNGPGQNVPRLRCRKLSTDSAAGAAPAFAFARVVRRTCSASLPLSSIAASNGSADAMGSRAWAVSGSDGGRGGASGTAEIRKVW